MNKDQWNKLVAGDLSEAEARRLEESLISDAMRFLEQAKDKIADWYRRYRRDKAYQEQEERALKALLIKRGYDLPGEESVAVRPSLFSRFKNWGLRIGMSVLKKIAGYLFYLVEPKLQRSPSGEYMTPQYFDVLMLGAAVVAGSMGFFTIAAIFLTLKMGGKAFRDVLQSVAARSQTFESREKAISNVLNNDLEL